MEIPEQIWFLMSRSLSGEATAAEQEALQQELQGQPVLQQQYELMKRLWQGEADWQQEAPEDTVRVNRILQLSAAEDVLHNANVEHEQTGEHEITPSPVRPMRRRVWKSVYGRVAIAAGLFIGLLALAHWVRDGRNGANKSEIVAGRGSKTRTILPDGSTVWLNAGSRISYEPGFSGASREVTLQGEAFFDVVKQPAHPFIVHAGELNIRVLGTSFNVKSYEEDTTVETTLIHGMVEITGSKAVGHAPIYLHPHEKIVLPRQNPGQMAGGKAGQSNAAREPRIIPIDSSMKEDVRVETSWVYNRLEFRGDSFDELARKLERWYNINIRFGDEAARKLTFNGSLESETVEQAFLALSTAEPFRFTINKNEIYIQSVEKKEPVLTH